MFEKRFLGIVLGFVLAVSIFGVYAQDNSGEGSQSSGGDVAGDDSDVESGDASDDLTDDSDDVGDDDFDDNGFDDGDEDGDEDEIDDDFAGAEFTVSAGITPDNKVFYNIDRFFERFSDDFKVTEERLAEIEAMVEMGDYESARIAFEHYKETSDNLEKEIEPGKRDEIKRRILGVRRILSKVSEEEGDIFDEILEKEKSLATASAIASKVEELCRELSGLDLGLYYETCQADDEDEHVPKWKKKLRQELTDVQREEVKVFGNIMAQCFKTGGAECDCKGIADIGPHMQYFASACFTIAPLANACENEGNEDACEAMDDIEVPELPPHLQDIMDEIDNEIGEEQFDRHMPRECVEAGARTPKDCMKVMIETNAPEECRNALVDADVQNEREAREICEEIMFELNAPEECVKAGLRDHKECGKFMFQQNAPQECIDAGLTGENRNDPRKCEEIMNKFGGDRRGPNRGPGPGFNPDCRRIEDAEERLRCYDEAVNSAGEHFEDRRGPGGGFPDECRKAGALDRESCERVMRQDFDERFRETKDAERQCAESCRDGRWDFTNGECRCYRDEERDYRGDFEGYQGQPPPPGYEYGPPSEGFQPPEEYNSPPEEYSPSPEYSPEPTPELEPSLSPEPTPEPTTTGGVVWGGLTGNAFLDYYWE